MTVQKTSAEMLLRCAVCIVFCVLSSDHINFYKNVVRTQFWCRNPVRKASVEVCLGVVFV